MQINQNIKIAVDAIVFGYRNAALHVLLVRQKFGIAAEKWVLPGGFVHDDESLSDAVRRELREETGTEAGYLEQLYTFGDDPERDPRFRVVSVAYFALVNPEKLELSAETNTDAHDARWFPLHELPALAFDHRQMVDTALLRLQAKISYQPIGFDLLADEFLFSDLENLYMAISGQNIDRRNFRKKMLSFGILEEIDKISKKNSGRPGKFFRFNRLKYKALAAGGFYFEIKFA
jgi:8-oxo-dGTP diphosphatase